METSVIYNIRRENVRRLVLDRFAGNKSSFARATGVHPNHINLLLSMNEEHRRNLGEKMARRIEEALGLVSGWLDAEHDGSVSDIPINISRRPIHDSISGALRTASAFISVAVATVGAEDLRKRSTDMDNLFLAEVSTNDLLPSISEGATVIVDSGVTSYAADGIYLLSRPGAAGMLRRLGRNVTGDLVMSRHDEPPAVLGGQLPKSMTVVGRVVGALRLEVV